jgi:Ca2+-binding EF-hand superfamily protein
MKLLAVVIATVLALPAAARADEVLNPPSGPVYEQVNNPQGMPAPRDPQQRAKNQQLKKALLAQFDRNGDGRLGPRERMHAIKVLRRIEMRLAGRGQQGQGQGQGMNGPQRGQGKRQKFIQRFDTNGDGNVDRSEMPPGAARRMRRFDRDRDGWIEPGEAR